MTAQAPSKQRYKYDNDQFPILFENSDLRIYKNPSDEIFVKDKRSGAQMRIDAYPHLNGGLRFTTDARVEPIRVANMIGWSITPR